jgi:hypothetical protein
VSKQFFCKRDISFSTSSSGGKIDISSISLHSTPHSLSATKILAIFTKPVAESLRLIVRHHVVMQSSSVSISGGRNIIKMYVKKK